MVNWQQPINCLSVFDNFVGLALKALMMPTCLLFQWLLDYWYIHYVNAKSVQNGMVNLNYFLLKKVNWLMNKIINLFSPPKNENFNFWDPKISIVFKYEQLEIHKCKV